MIILITGRYLYQANQLKSVTRNGVVATYKYDGDGLKREKNNGSTTRFYYDGENIIAEGSVSGSTVNFKARYVRGYQLISMKNQLGTVGYYLENGHGDVVNLYKQDQTLLNTYDYDLWGNPKVTEEADQYSNPFRYAGEYWDTNTGLQNLRARWYDPSIGRFITEDTWEGRINYPDSQNPYIYVVNNPLIYVDPSGHIFDVIFDVASLAYDAYEFVKDPSWENAGYIALDVASVALPFVPSGSSAIRATSKAASKADDVSDAVSSAKKSVSSLCNCFVEGTEVLTDQGEQPIKEIKVGDKVLSKDDETGEVAYKEVVALFQKQADQIYTIHIGEEIIEVTGEHPFWLDGQGWTLVKELKVGDLLVSSEGSKLAITEIEKEPRQTTVYNFEVKDFNSYFVSDLGVWVHNCAVGGTRKGGRLGNQTTRDQNKGIADKLESKDWTITGGGGKLKEEYLPGPNGGRKGSNWVDVTAEKNGKTLRINTVDTRANGQMTTREANAAQSIKNKTSGPGSKFIAIPK